MGRISSRFRNSKVMVTTRSDKSPASLGLAGVLLMEELSMAVPLCFCVSSQPRLSAALGEVLSSSEEGALCSVAQINAPHPSRFWDGTEGSLSLWTPSSAHFAQLLSLASSWPCFFPAPLLCKPRLGQSQGEVVLDPRGVQGCAAACTDDL